MANHIASTNPGVKLNENLGKILIKVYTERQLIHQTYLLGKITEFGSSAVSASIQTTTNKLALHLQGS